MVFVYEHEGIAASIFLSFYVVYFVIAVIVVFKKGPFTFYSALLAFGLIRMGAQISGIGFAKEGISNWHWLVAYLVLGAEGYFILILCTLYLLIKIEVREYGWSWLENQVHEGMTRPALPRPKRKPFTTLPTYKDIYHQLLVVGNVMIIVGGTMLASIDAEEYAKKSDKINTSKALRSAGQCIFLAQTLSIVAISLYMCFKKHVRLPSLFLVMVICPFLIVRGVYGVISIFIDKLNYYLIANYSSEGFKDYFLITEYCMSTTMEFIASIILMLDFFAEKHRNGLDHQGEISTSKENLNSFIDV